MTEPGRGNPQEKQEEEDTRASGPLGTVLPPDQAVLRECRRLIGDRNSRVDNLSTACLQDPVILIELLKKANALYFAGGRTAITSAKTAIVRLGSDVVLELFEKLAERSVLEDDQVNKWLRTYRSRSRRIGIIARIFAEAIARPLAEDCQAIGSLASVGDILAVCYLKEDYVKLAESKGRNAVNYSLGQNHRFDVERMGVAYLRRCGVPEALLFALDRDARSRNPERSVMKPLCMAAEELVDAFDNDKWEKFAPGRRLAPKSAVRMLQMNDNQYLKIYERASEFLFSLRMMEQRAQQPAEEERGSANGAPEDAAENSLESEIQSILLDAESGEAEEDPASEGPQGLDETEIKEITESLGQLEQQFSLAKKEKSSSSPRRTDPDPEPAVQAPVLRTAKGTKLVEDISSMMEEADNSEELLSSLLQRLVDGPFEKAALIVVSHDRTQAIVVAARGPIGNGQKIEITDPLSPLAKCFTKVQSYSSKPNEASPWGSRSFAVSPIDADHDTPVALYADCGSNGALTFEARRIFRNVVGILNQKLPTIPGGIPVELKGATP